jgi:hypothetical protein
MVFAIDNNGLIVEELYFGGHHIDDDFGGHKQGP